MQVMAWYQKMNVTKWSAKSEKLFAKLKYGEPSQIKNFQIAEASTFDATENHQMVLGGSSNTTERKSLLLAH